MNGLDGYGNYNGYNNGAFYGYGSASNFNLTAVDKVIESIPGVRAAKVVASGNKMWVAIMTDGTNTAGRDRTYYTNEIERRLSEIDFPEGYSFEWAGSAEMMQEAMQQMLRAGLLAFLLLFMLLAAILESFRQPLLILSTIPLTFIGIFFIQYLSGMTMNIMSMMAMIMLMGIVVTNAILILDYANMRIKEGRTVKEALLEACPIKLKPILMLNLAIILGMLPMALGIGGSGKEFRQAMGIVSIGGLIMATVLSFFVIPALFYITTKASKRRIPLNK